MPVNPEEQAVADESGLGMELIAANLAGDSATVERLFAADPRGAFESLLGHASVLLELHYGGVDEALFAAQFGATLFTLIPALELAYEEETSP